MQKKAITGAASIAAKIGQSIKTTKGKIIYAVLLVIIAVAVLFLGGRFGLWENPVPEFGSGGNSVAANDTLKVHYIDVGQGDCQLVECDGKYMLIDAGENGFETDVLNYLRKIGVKKLEYVVASHQHSDHIGGLPEVLDEFETVSIIMPRLTKAQTPTNSTYKAFLKSVKNSGAKVIEAKVGAVYNLGSANFEILGPVTDDAEDINNMTAMMRLDYGENSFLFTGDAETEEELEILANGANLDCDVLKAGHHGSGTSSCKDFLSAVKPEICIISCGADNSYGHPHDNALKRIKKHTQEIYRTDICGDIVITSDGKNLSVEYEKQ